MPSKASGKKSSDKSKSKGVTGKSAKAPADFVEVPPIALKDVRRKITSTASDVKDYTFEHFRCFRCNIVLNCFQAFIEHSCWQKYYDAKFHLGCTQAFACRVCEFVFYSYTNYASHLCFNKKRCDEPEFWQPEEIVPITYENHHDYYIKWARQSELDSSPLEPDYHCVCRCCRCSKRFKSKIEFTLHSCCLFIVFRPPSLRRLKICMHCKYVFQNEAEFKKHLCSCDRKKAHCVDFALSTTEIGCQQFVTGRHCYDFDYYLHKSEGVDAQNSVPVPITVCPSSTLNGKAQAISSCCMDCGFEQPNLCEFLFHPCVAGKRLTPMNLELLLFCCECECLFVDVFECIDHMKSCSPVSFIFIRLNTPDLIRTALKRWMKEMEDNPHLPPRPSRFRCSDCEEIFRQFICFLQHPCPRRQKYERMFIQPMGVMETYSCEACHIVTFSISEAVEHSKVCNRGCYPHMVQIHYSMDEVVTALTPWMQCPQILKFNIVIGVGDEEEELQMRVNEFMESRKLPTDELLARFRDPATKPSKRIDDWIERNITQRAIRIAPEALPKPDYGEILAGDVEKLRIN